MLMPRSLRIGQRWGKSGLFHRGGSLLRTLYEAAPWRTFRWYYGQRHYSGSYWSATQRDHVIYESRLELAALLFADYDQSVGHIVAQPFQLKTQVDGQSHKHVPDYLWDTADGPVVVDVVRAKD